jgi:hypothetical protein
MKYRKTGEETSPLIIPPILTLLIKRTQARSAG